MATDTPAGHQDAFDAWWDDDAEHSVNVMSIGDECWQALAYNAALAAYAAGRAAQREADARLAEQLGALYPTYEMPDYTTSARKLVPHKFADLLRREQS